MIYIASEEIKEVYQTIELLKEKTQVNSFDILLASDILKYTYTPKVIYSN